MEPPESQGGKTAAALGIVGAGMALGGVAGALYLPGKAKTLGGVMGAVVGAGLTGVAALAMAEFVGGDWEDVERMAGLIGAGGVGLLAAAGVAKEVVQIKEALAAPAAPAQLPGAPNYTATESDSGRTLVVSSGETIAVMLPGSGWQWAAPAGLVSIASQTPDSNTGTETTVLVAGSGSGLIQATIQGATFTLTVNVV